MSSRDLQELWALPVDVRAQVLFDSGIHPDNDAARALFASCESVLWIGAQLVAAIATGRTPNARFYTGEHRDDPVMWPDGCPVPQRKRAISKGPSKRALERAAQEFYRENGLFKRLPCRCVDECPGLDWHVKTEAAEEARERELLEALAAWYAHRERARMEVVNELARVTLSLPVDVDPAIADEFSVILERGGSL